MCKLVKYFRPKCGHEIYQQWEEDKEDAACEGRCARPPRSRPRLLKKGKNSQSCKEDCTIIPDERDAKDKK
jgi:hypothetical protein